MLQSSAADVKVPLEKGTVGKRHNGKKAQGKKAQVIKRHKYIKGTM